MTHRMPHVLGSDVMGRGHEFPLSQRGRGGPVNILLKHTRLRSL